MEFIKIDNGLTTEDKKAIAEIDNLIFELKDLNMQYKKLEPKLKSKRATDKEKQQIKMELTNIRFAHAAIAKKLNKKQNELYGS